MYWDLYGDAMLGPMLVPIRMGSKMAAGNQQKHLSLSFAPKAQIDLSKNSKSNK